MNATTIKIKGYPAGKVEAARELLGKAHAKLVKAAAKAGQAAPEAPAVVVLAERAILRCRRCNRRGPDAGSWRLAPVGSLAHQWGLEYGDAVPCDPLGFGSFGEAPCVGFMRAVDVVDLEVTAARPKLAGWEFLAVVEALEGGNLLRGVPGAVVADGELDSYRTGDAGRCDHCATKRRRAETFVVRGDAGELRQVGRQCLADFLGGKSPAEVLASLTYEKMLRDLGDSEGSGGGGRESYDPAEFMTWTAASIRTTGWCSRGAARDRDKQATADHVQYLLAPPWSATGLNAWEKARAACRPTDADKAKGAAALAWAKDLAAPGASRLSDYEQNLALVARQARLDPKHAGILASAVSGYECAQGRIVEAARKAAAPSEHVGEVGKRVEIAATVERVATIETQYGNLHIHTMRDAAGNALIWKTSSVRMEPGQAVAGKGTIKAHSEFRGEKQTELARCALK